MIKSKPPKDTPATPHTVERMPRELQPEASPQPPPRKVARFECPVDREPEPTPAPPPIKRWCENCNCQLPSDRYCPNCGCQVP